MPEILYDQVKAAQYMARLLHEKYFNIDDGFLDYLRFIGANLKSLLKNVIEDVENWSGGRDKEEVLNLLYSDETTSLCSLYRELCSVAQDYPYIQTFIRERALKICEEISNYQTSDAKNYELARKKFETIFGLNNCALDFLEFAYISEANNYVECYFSGNLKILKARNKKILACLLNTNISSLNDTIRELETYKLLDVQTGTGRGYGLSLSNILIKFFECPEISPNDLFCVQMKGETLPLENFNIKKEDLNYVVRLLKSKSSAPVHIMLYGPPGTGKTTFARSLAKSLGLKAFTINVRENVTSESATAVIACMNIASRHPKSFVVVDEAEKILDTSLRDISGEHVKDKLWLNTLLEKPNNHVIWITNHVNNIHPSVMRRFSFSVFFEAPGRKEREKLFFDIIKRHKVEKYFTNSQIKSLAKDYEVPAAVIENSINRAEILKYNDDDFVPAVECSMKAYTTFLRGGREITRKAGSEVKNFTLEGLTLNNAEISDLMERCVRADEFMRNPKSKIEGGCATMLFYGPPGTGKTALARHIAHELDRECFIQRASDLQNCFVGETEKKIAEAFRHAEEEGAVLVIDEADTFLYSRDMAVRSWEVSFVNEFLVNLEECKCFCICTTNRLEELDPASLRRFLYKIKFDYAGSSQITALYNSLLKPICNSELPSHLERELKTFTKLTPGDFHSVRAQYNSFLSNRNTVTHEILINALRHEMSMKHEKSKAGFQL
ncbi:MAG: ATP-binding protein [Synergistaceae bacterium]|nr:ATP-binding protein [Synergistaceae bacterium]